MLQRIRSFFTKVKYYSHENFNINDYELVFSELNDEILMDISVFIKDHLVDSKNISDRKNGLKKTSSLKFDNIDSLIKKLLTIVESDYNETLKDSEEFNWKFKYFIDKSIFNDNTIAIFNVLSDKNGEIGDLIYKVAALRKSKGIYYLWEN